MEIRPAATRGLKPTLREFGMNIVERIVAAGRAQLESGTVLIGILESRSSLAQRIRRMTGTRLPKSATLGAFGAALVVIAGIVLVPMSGRRESVAADGPAAASTKSEEARPAAKKQAAGAQGQGAPAANQAKLREEYLRLEKLKRVVLRGRVMDLKGNPIGNAEVSANSRAHGSEYGNTRTKADGTFELATFRADGTLDAAQYSFQIRSPQHVWLGFPRDITMTLNPAKPEFREFKLKPACKLKIRVVDEQNQPVVGAKFFLPWPIDFVRTTTGRDGTAVLTGLPPLDKEQQIAIWHKGFAWGRVRVKLTDPEVLVEREVVLAAGMSIKGKATTSDGLPAEGWSLQAEPVWYDYSSSPGVTVPVAADGTFELVHVGPDRQNVSAYVKMADAHQRIIVLNDVDLSKQTEPLTIRLKYPSLKSLAEISGRVRIRGMIPKYNFDINAFADSGQFGSRGNVEVHPPGKQGQAPEAKPGELYEYPFRIKQLPRGRYTLSVHDSEFIEKEVHGITAPSKDFVVELVPRSDLRLSGRIAAAGGELKQVRVRWTFKTSTRRGISHAPFGEWQDVAGPDYKFRLDLPGGGMYVLEAVADGYALTRSESINSDAWSKDKELVLKLLKGIDVAGLVVDEAGQPVNGATVFCRTIHGSYPASVVGLTNGTGIKTVAGKFILANLLPPGDSLKVIHPDYAPSRDLFVKFSEGEQPELMRIVLKRGGTIRGRVYDESSKPVAGATVEVQENLTHYHDEEARRRNLFARVTTDSEGNFEAKHLPEQQVFVCRIHDEDSRFERISKSLGVMHQTVRVMNGATVQVDLGGTSIVSGRLIVGGEPLADTRVMLAGNMYSHGTSAAVARTDAQGKFEFRGVYDGEHYVYFMNSDSRFGWQQVQVVQVVGNRTDLGDVAFRPGSVIVKLPDVAKSELGKISVKFEGTKPWNGNLRPDGRKSEDSPYLFKNLIAGKYKAEATDARQVSVSQEVEITPERRHQTVSLQIPVGTAKVEGTIEPYDKTLAISFVLLYRKDGRFRAHIQSDAQRRFELSRLPAGDYFFSQQPDGQPVPVVEFSLKEGETKSFAFTQKVLQAKQPEMGYVALQTQLPNGVVINGCDLRWSGGPGVVEWYSGNQGTTLYRAKPGTYELTVSFPGRKVWKQSVEFKTTAQTRLSVWNHEVVVTLEPEG